MATPAQKRQHQPRRPRDRAVVRRRGSVMAAQTGTLTSSGSAARLDSGSSCLDTCSCNRCASSTVACYSNPGCRALVECATANRCTDTVCGATKCQAQFAAAGSAIALAQAFATCYFGQCVSMCPTEAGPPDASRE